MSLVIRGAEIVTAADRYVADVKVTGETIAAIGAELPAESGDEIVDGSDQWLIPGGIDPHVHMALPFMGTVSIDDFESGSIAAIMGGTTGMIDFVIPAKGESLLETLETWHEKAAGKAAHDYTFHMAVTDWDERIAREIPIVVREHGITSFKIFMAYKGVLGVDDEQIFHILEATRDAGGFVNVHAVNGDVQLLLADRFAERGDTGTRWHALAQPPRAEGEATGRVIDLGAVAGQQVYIVHVTCDDAVERIAAARGRGEPVWGETCTQYLLLDDSLYDLPDFEGAKYVLSPPLRKKVDQEALWNALADRRSAAARGGSFPSPPHRRQPRRRHHRRRRHLRGRSERGLAPSGAGRSRRHLHLSRGLGADPGKGRCQGRGPRGDPGPRHRAADSGVCHRSCGR